MTRSWWGRWLDRSYAHPVSTLAILLALVGGLVAVVPMLLTEAM